MYSKLSRFISYFAMIVISIISLLPILWMLSTAFKTRAQCFVVPPEWIPAPVTLDNFRKVINEIKLLKFLFNSAFVSITVLAGQLFIDSMAAYAFARLRFKGRDLMFVILLSSIMIPQAVSMIPQYILMQKIGWIDTYKALIVPQIFSNVLGVFLLRQFLLGLPKELEESSKIDGAGIIKTFVLIILPQVKPALITVGIMSFMASWNNFLWPLIVVNSPEKQVLTVGISLLQGQFVSDWPSIMAGATITLGPLLLLYIFAQRYFIESIYMTGIK